MGELAREGFTGFTGRRGCRGRDSQDAQGGRAVAGGIHRMHRVGGLSREGFTGCIGEEGFRGRDVLDSQGGVEGCRGRDSNLQPSGVHTRAVMGSGWPRGWTDVEVGVSLRSHEVGVISLRFRSRSHEVGGELLLHRLALLRARDVLLFTCILLFTTVNETCAAIHAAIHTCE